MAIKKIVERKIGGWLEKIKEKNREGEELEFLER
jgi:hypothetical protein